MSDDYKEYLVEALIYVRSQRPFLAHNVEEAERWAEAEYCNRFIGSDDVVVLCKITKVVEVRNENQDIPPGEDETDPRN